MKTYLDRNQKSLSRLLLAALLLQIGFGEAQAIPIETGDVDLTRLVAFPPALDGARLMKWRTGAPNQPPQPASQMTFEHFLRGGTIPYPDRGVILDYSANNQGDLWSDNAIEVQYRPGNTDTAAIIIYTKNGVSGEDTGQPDRADPLYTVDMRGGLIGGFGSGDTHDPNRVSILPLLWKAVAGNELQRVSTATVTGTYRLPLNPPSPLLMPQEIENLLGGECNENPGDISRRPNNGFCDYSTHYMVDFYNRGTDNRFYTAYPVGDGRRRTNFDYISLVGRFGVNTTEQGHGTGRFRPMYALLGIKASSALPTHYGTIIYVELRSFQ